MVSPLAEHNAWLSACMTRSRLRQEPRLEPLPMESCLAVSPVSEDVCYFVYGHTGPHSWRSLTPIGDPTH